MPVTVAFDDEVRNEFDRWRDALPEVEEPDSTVTWFPPITSPDGLPHGWRIRARSVNALRSRPAQTLYCVVSRDAGGWMLMRHKRAGSGHARTFITDIAEDFASLVTDLNSYVLSTARRTEVALIHDLMVSSYNPDIPAEEAEQILIALGAPAHLVPAALTGDTTPAGMT